MRARKSVNFRAAKIGPAVVAQVAGNTPKTTYSNYASHVSIDEQRKAEKVFDRVRTDRMEKSKTSRKF